MMKLLCPAKTMNNRSPIQCVPLAIYSINQSLGIDP
nr:MAG TPA: hypothetical protein [Caudoviricetes sp.]